MSRLELRGVEHAYGAFSLGPVDLTVGEEVLAVLGPSGCGKTTLLSAVAGVVVPDAGRVLLDGRDLTDRPIERRGTAFLFQDGALFPHLTARENVAYAATSDARVDRFAELLELDGVLDRRPRALSGGERQRVALARALAADPDVLLLDEPLSSLDVPIRRRLREEMRDLLAELGIPVLYVTHDRAAAAVVGDRLGVMRDGDLLQVDDPETVFRRPASPFVASFTGNDNVFRARFDAKDHGDHDDRDCETAVLDWHGRRVRAPAVAGGNAGTQVRFCIRPEYVVLAAELSGRPNEFVGTVRRCRFEGTTTRVSIALGPADTTMVAVLSPAAFDDLEIAPGDEVIVHFPPEAVHVLAGPVEGKSRPSAR